MLTVLGVAKGRLCTERGDSGGGAYKNRRVLAATVLLVPVIVSSKKLRFF